MKELLEQIKALKFERLYVFYGEENYLKNSYADKIVNAVMSKDARLMNLDILDEKTYSADILSDKCETIPFMADTRVIIIRDSNVFAPGKKDESAKTEKYLTLIPETAIVIFIENKIDKRLSLFKASSKVGKCVEFKTPYEKDLIKWIINIAKSNNKKIAPQTCAFFLQTVNSDMDTLILELNKLIDYSGDTIEKSDILTVTTKSLESRVFDLVDAIGNKNLRDALDIYNNLLFLKESPLGILAMMARQFKLMLACGELKSKNKSTQQIADAMNLKSFAVSGVIDQSVNFTSDTLKKAFRECLETDVNIKTGKISDALGVEILIIKYSGYSRTC